MKKLVLSRMIPFALATTVMLSGCGKKSECEIPTRHVHKYIKQVTDDVQIETFLDDEHLSIDGYQWNEQYMEITKDDEAMYKTLRSKNLFEGKTNWDYLYHKMASYHDYLEFYYYYTTEEVYSITDSDGNTTFYTETVVHEGWHQNPYDFDNTGKTRLYHHRFYGYRVIYSNGKFKLEASPSVDDIREIIDEYPYFNENGIDLVYETFYFPRTELPNLSVDDFNTFNAPDLENKDLETGKIKIK